MRIISWNVNGIRAVAKKNLFTNLEEMNADVFCFQETKAQDDQVVEALSPVDGFHLYSNSAVRKGYSGTAVLTKDEPVSVNNDIGIEEHDQEGRVITTEYDQFYLVTVYVPNSGSGLVRLEYRKQWDKDFLAFLKKLEDTKPVVVCGDLNVAHKDIDLKNPKPNYNKSAGYMQEEIDGLDNYVKAGFVDTFRALQAEEVKYSWWSYRGGARSRNVGWRIDYFLVSESLLPNIKKAFILNDIMDSDHCPVGIELSF